MGEIPGDHEDAQYTKTNKEPVTRKSQKRYSQIKRVRQEGWTPGEVDLAEISNAAFLKMNVQELDKETEYR